MKATAYWVLPGERGRLESEDLPTWGEVSRAEGRSVLVETHFSGISPGTETLVHRGGVPAIEHERMRAPFQTGPFSGPLKYGYSSAGVIIAGAEEEVGRRVFVLHPHQDRYWVPLAAVRTVPDTVPLARATLAANMETALNALWDARPVAGDRVTVVGAGSVGGLLTALLCRSLALEVQVIEPKPTACAWLAELGARVRTPEEAWTAQDFVFHTSATEAGLETALGLLRPGGTLVELSWYGASPVALSLGGAFHSQRLRIVSSQVGSVSPNKPGWSYGQRLDLALRLLDDARLDVLVASRVDFERLPEHFERMALHEEKELRSVRCVEYQSGRDCHG